MATDFNKTKDKTTDVERRKPRGPQIFRKPKDGAQSGTPLFLRNSPVTSQATRAGAVNVAGQAHADTIGADADEQNVDALSLIVEDSADQTIAGQMRRSEFLEELKKAVSAEAESALSGTLWSAVGCPWIDHWFGYYSTVDAGRIERAIRKYAPESSGAQTAGQLIPIITRRVRLAIEAWSATGSVSDLPADASAQGGAPDPGNESGILFKEREGASAGPGDSMQAQARLGSGAPLDSRVRSGMESVYGKDFSQVRVHTDSSAADLSSGFNARAFTIGDDIAFAPGEYQPGNPIGDAIIAHELAHVAQQKGGGQADGLLPKSDDATTSLEEDADFAAVGAVVSMWTGMKNGLTGIARSAMPRLRSGLRLQRCGSRTEPKKTAITKLETKGEVLFPGKDAKGPQAGIVGTGETAGKVVVRKGDVLTYQKTPQSDIGYVNNLFALEYSGPKASAAHWVQFAWIEMKDYTTGTPLQGYVNTAARGKQPLTTDSTKKNWLVDSAGVDPYYEVEGYSIREPDKITIFDQPGGQGKEEGKEVAKMAAENGVSPDFIQYIAHLESYLVQDGVGVFRVNWNANTIYLKGDNGSYNGGQTEYVFEGADAVSKIPDDFLKLIPEDFKSKFK